MSPASSKSRRPNRAKARAAALVRNKAVAKASISQASPEELASAARDAEAAGNLDKAITFFESALTLLPTDPSLIEELAVVYLQADRQDDAERALRAAVQQCPDAGFEKFGYLAQVLGNTHEALAFARQGLQLITAERAAAQTQTGNQAGEAAPAADDSRNTAEVLRALEASAQCAIAEICLGITEDSNDPALATEMDPQVEAAVMAALVLSEQGDSTEIEATLALANLRLSQARRGDAEVAMKRILEAIRPALKQLDEGDGSDRCIIAALQQLPVMEIRIAVGKQLLEVALWRDAVSVLASVMWECDFNVEVWYMLAIAYWKLGETREARSMLDSTRAVLHRPEGHDGNLDEDMIDKLILQLDRVSGGDSSRVVAMEE